MTKHTGYKRLVAVVVAAAVLVSAAATVFAVSFPAARDALQMAFHPDAASQADRQTAQQIADMTGASVYRLLEMKASLGSWNEVISSIEEEGIGNQDLSEEELEGLIGKFAQEERQQASDLVSRVLFNLREINAKNTAAELPVSQPTVDPQPGAREEQHDFEKLEGQFLKNRAIWLMLETQQKYGSLEKALDEYLYSLQIEVDFELAYTQPDEYEKQTAEKGGQLLREDAITVMVIEEKMLELLSQSRQPEATLQPDLGEAIDSDDKAEPEVSLPDALKIPDAEKPASGVPEVQRPGPERPAADVYEEIERINRESRRGTVDIGGEIR